MNVSTVARRALLSVAFLIASPLVLAQATATAAPSVNPAIAASPTAATSPSVDQARATLKADANKLNADRAAHASDAQLALDKGNLRADRHVLRSAHVPGQTQAMGDHRHGHHGHHRHGHHGHHHHAAPSVPRAASAVPASSAQ